MFMHRAVPTPTNYLFFTKVWCHVDAESTPVLLAREEKWVVVMNIELKSTFLCVSAHPQSNMRWKRQISCNVHGHSLNHHCQIARQVKISAVKQHDNTVMRFFGDILQWIATPRMLHTYYADKSGHNTPHVVDYL